MMASSSSAGTDRSIRISLGSKVRPIVAAASTRCASSRALKAGSIAAFFSRTSRPRRNTAQALAAAGRTSSHDGGADCFLLPRAIALELSPGEIGSVAHGMILPRSATEVFGNFSWISFLYTPRRTGEREFRDPWRAGSAERPEEHVSDAVYPPVAHAPGSPGH